jgi:hypothetical protein
MQLNPPPHPFVHTGRQVEAWNARIHERDAHRSSPLTLRLHRPQFHKEEGQLARRFRQGLRNRSFCGI